jgi:hypothetical protein
MTTIITRILCATDGGDAPGNPGEHLLRKRASTSARPLRQSASSVSAACLAGRTCSRTSRSPLVPSYAVNHLIDGLGPRRSNGRGVRSPLTHSVFTAPVWGAGAAYTMWLEGSTYGLTGGVVPFSSAGLLVTYSHLFSDSMTEGGASFVTERIAHSHVRNNGPLSVLWALCWVTLLLN